MYTYRCILDRVVDGDTVDVHIDLGFNVWLHSQRVRLEGIDCPEARTRDLTEKAFGLAATQRVIDLTSTTELVLHSKNFEGKFGRILGDLELKSINRTLTEVLLEEGHAVLYDQTAELKEQAFLENRKKLLALGVVIL